MLVTKSIVLFAALAAGAVNSFQPMSCRNHHQNALCAPRATVEDEMAAAPFDENDVLLTPSQIKLLRKESLKRRARKAIATYHVPEDEAMGPFSADTLGSIAKDYFRNEENHIELVEIKGIAKGERRYARQVAERLAIEVGMELDADVAVVELKGHTATFYCAAEDDNSSKIILRNSYQPGAWKKRDKAPRDHRGQIIKD